MIRVLIADNDSDNRKNFKIFIRSLNDSFQTVSSIDDSKDIINVVTESNIDLIIADIKFFGAGGFQKIKILHEFHKDIKLILYGTYSDTAYMQKALEYGVITYMYKPVKPNELTRCLNNAKIIFEELEIKKKNDAILNSAFEANIPLFEDRFLINLIHGHINSETEIKETFNYFNMNLSQGYTVFVVKIDHYRQIFLTMDQKERYILIFTMLNKILDKLNAIKNGTAFINHFNSVSVLLGDNYPDIMSLCGEIKDMIKIELDILVSIGIGRTYEDELSIPVSYREAKSALRYNFCMGYNSIIHIQFVEPQNTTTYRYPLKKEELLVYSAVIGDIQSAILYTDEIFYSLKGMKDISISHVQKIILDILVSINRYASESKSILEQSFSKFFTISDISKILTLDEAHNYLISTLSKFCELVNYEREQRDLKILDLCKSEIDTQYYLNISLSKMATRLETTPEYLNKLFLDTEHKSFFDYAVGVRLNVAKKLLENPDLSDEAVAVSLGYEDVKYFRSIFQQYEGISIFDYRNKVKKTGGI